MKKILRTATGLLMALTVLAGTAFGASAASYKIDEIPNVQLADSTRFLSNPDGIVSPEGQPRIDALLQSIRRATTAEVAAVVVDKIDGSDPEGYANRLFNKWGIGKGDKKNGLLVLIVRDSRKVVIRTGKGLEGVLPDIVCGRIIRDTMVPMLREGNYDGALEAGLTSINNVLTNPEAAAEIRSEQTASDNETNPFLIYIYCACGLAVLLLVLLLIRLAALKGKQPNEKYEALEGLKAPYLAFSMLGLAIPVPVALLLMYLLKRYRNKTHICSNCGADMQKMDEQRDNDFLTPAQDLEEQLGSVDYDVWVCPDCGEVEVYPFVNKNTALFECEHCHARTMHLVSDDVAKQPTSEAEGVGVKTFDCINCHHRLVKKYSLPKLAGSAFVNFAIGAGIGAALGGRGGHGSGGGFSGGSFGGGSTGGGGASGSW